MERRPLAGPSALHEPGRRDAGAPFIAHDRPWRYAISTRILPWARVRDVSRAVRIPSNGNLPVIIGSGSMRPEAISRSTLGYVPSPAFPLARTTVVRLTCRGSG